MGLISLAFFVTMCISIVYCCCRPNDSPETGQDPPAPNSQEQYQSFDSPDHVWTVQGNAPINSSSSSPPKYEDLFPDGPPVTEEPEEN